MRGSQLLLVGFAMSDRCQLPAVERSGGKIVFNFGRSAFDCTIRQLTDASHRVRNTIGIPDNVQLLIVGTVRSSKRLRRRIGSSALPLRSGRTLWIGAGRFGTGGHPERRSGDILRGHMLSCARRSIEPVGILLLDTG